MTPNPFNDRRRLPLKGENQLIERTLAQQLLDFLTNNARIDTPLSEQLRRKSL